ncbi:hypothetical protein GG496_002017 [Candidatus Fervidibacteria bacterium JGI MDM2 JNZ-1-D12]
MEIQKSDLRTLVQPQIRKAGLVRGRVIVVTLVLAVVFTSATIWAALLRHEILGVGYLPRWVVSFFVVLIGINAVVKRLLPSFSLTNTELAFIFAILSVIASIPHEIGIHFYLNLLGLVYYSSPYSQWFGRFTPHLPEHLVPSTNFRDPAILWAYEGMPSGAKLPLANWFVPLLAWTPYIFGVYLVLVFLCLLLARQWEEHERLLYPLAQVPMELSGATQEHPTKSIFRSPLFWVGFIVATLPYSLRGLHLYFPFIPDPQPQRNLGVLFASGPLTAFNNIDLHLYPEMVGIAYFLSHEVGLSLWLFPFLRRAEVALRMAFGVDMYHAEFLTFQSVATYLVMAGSLLWLARGYLKEVGLTVLKWILRKLPHSETDRSNVPLTEAKALIGLLLAFGSLLLWAKLVAGVNVSWTALLLVGLVITGLVVARIVSEAGVYIFAPPFRAYQVIFDIFGKDRIGARNIVLLSAMGWIQIRSTGTMATGYIANSLRIFSSAGVDKGYGTGWMLIAILLTLLVCHIVFPTVIYTYSVPKLSWWAQTSSLNTANFVGQYLTTSRPLTSHHWWGLVIGAITCWALIKLRLNFVGFPLHPIGFVTWYGWPLDRYWMSVMLGWALKGLILHYGGFSAFQRFKPFAYGVTVGGTMTLTTWILLRLIFPTSESIIID